MKCDMVIFDVDGTLWNVSKILELAFKNVLRANGYLETVSLDTIKSGLGLGFYDFALHTMPFIKDDDERLCMVKKVEEEKFRIIDKTHVATYPRVVDTLKELSKTFKVGIVSNCGPHSIEQLLSKLDLESYVTDFCAASAHNWTKAKAISEVVKRNSSNNPVYVGDTLKDQLSCNESSVNFIWASYGFGKDISCDYSIKSIDELFKILEK